MKRREFIKKGLRTGIITSTVFTFGNFSSMFASTNNFANKKPFDLVAIKGGEPDIMFDKGIQSLGGIKAFVKKGQKVVVKPNIGWDTSPERAANTNPLLVKRIVQSCFEAGAKDVYVFDHTCDNWKRCYSNSGIENAVKDAGGKIVSGDSESYYQKVDIPKGKKLTSSKVHELILESDVFINVPILKHHGSADLTISMKNLMGNVWDRPYWHRNDLHQCIADFVSFRKPDLNVVDAYYVMKRNGPRGVSKEDVITLKSQIISTDIVAADAAAAKLFNSEPEDIGYIRIAHEMNLGNKNLDQLNISRIKL
ncbi:MAG: DUF362 domain-containing protein [Ignavibacteriaceae bacterium]|nr:DUF362 domain-containing protein [Ignavibacteriaceae bacterium]